MKLGATLRGSELTPVAVLLEFAMRRARKGVRCARACLIVVTDAKGVSTMRALDV